MAHRSELKPGLTEDERQERLKQAMAGRNVLLVLDDLWDVAEPTGAGVSGQHCST